MCCTVKITKNHVNNNGTKNGEINTTSMTLQPQNEIAAYWNVPTWLRYIWCFFFHSLLYFVKNNFFPVARPLRLLLSFATLCYFFFSIVARQSFSSECREHKSGSSTRVLCVYMHDFAMLSIIQTIQNCLSKWWKSTAIACEQRYKRTTTNDK